MKRQIFFIFSFLLVIAQVYVSAQQVETRNLSSFDEVGVSGNLDVYLERGNNESVRIEVRGIDPSEIRTEVRDGKLKIYRKSRIRWGGNVKGKIYVTYRNLRGLQSSGSSDIYGYDPINAEQFKIGCSGSGNITLDDLNANELTVHVSGSSDIRLAGNVDSQELHISGSGDYDAFDLECRETTISISGSGNAEVVAHQSLKVSVSGSGDVRYIGNPDYMDSSSSGSGSIRKAR